MKINAVVVTFNKIEMLRECLTSVLSQNDICNVELQLYVVDNNSTDGTQELLRKEAKKNVNIHPIFSKENIGGAGGFYLGMKQAMLSDPDYIWVMDDDTMPTPSALYELVSASEKIHRGGNVSVI